MQDEYNSVYSGRLQAEYTQKYFTNHNNYMIDLCLASVGRPNRYVDFGAGIGTLSAILKEKTGIDPVCVDIDEENIDRLSDQNFQCVRHINDIEGGVDLVFSSNVLEHIEDDVGVLNTIKGKLDKGGYLYLILPAHKILWSELDVIVGHYRRYTRSEITQKLNSTGFEIESVHFSDSAGFFGLFAIKLFGYNADRGLGSPLTIKMYDRYILPLSKFLDAIGFKWLFGKNVVAVAKRMD